MNFVLVLQALFFWWLLACRNFFRTIFLFRKFWGDILSPPPTISHGPPVVNDISVEKHGPGLPNQETSSSLRAP